MGTTAVIVVSNIVNHLTLGIRSEVVTVLNVSKRVITPMPKIPARCNKRTCQTRRNLSKRPEQYLRWPTCNNGGCKGLMYVDEYRLRRGPKDKAPICHDDCRPHIHRVDDRQCKKHEDYIISKAFEPKSKHSPIKQSHEPEF